MGNVSVKLVIIISLIIIYVFLFPIVQITLVMFKRLQDISAFAMMDTIIRTPNAYYVILIHTLLLIEKHVYVIRVTSMKNSGKSV